MFKLVNCDCNTLATQGVSEYKTSRIAMMEEGEVVIPIVLDLIEYYSVCGKQYESLTLAEMFKDNAHTINTKASSLSNRSHHIQKRFAPLILAGVGLAAAAWGLYKMSDTEEAMRNLRRDMHAESSYLASIMLNASNENSQNFIAVRRKLQDMQKLNHNLLCLTTVNMTSLMLHFHQLQEFDDIVESLHSQRLTTKIIPPSQMHDLIAKLPILSGTIYDAKPYLLYHTTKLQFNLAEAGEMFLRGTLIIPIIRKTEDVNLRLMRSVDNGALSLFGPEYVTSTTSYSMRKCKFDVDIYICKHTDLSSMEFHQMLNPFWSQDGLIIINTGINATIAKKAGALDYHLIGPAVCIGNDVEKVSINGYNFYTQASALHVQQEDIDFSVISDTATLIFKNSSMEAISKYIQEQNAQVWYYDHLMHFSWTLILTVLFVAFILFYCLYRKCHKKKQSVPPHVDFDMRSLDELVRRHIQAKYDMFRAGTMDLDVRNPIPSNRLPLMPSV